MKRPDPIAEQAKRVNEAYALTGDCNPEYEREFDKLARMRAAQMAADFRAERGLPPSAPTPYDDKFPPRAIGPGENEYGLDVPYFNEVLRRDLSNLSNKRPEELARICLRIAETACASVLAEPEFVAHFSSALGLEGTNLRGDAALGRLMSKLESATPDGWGVSLTLDAKGFALSLLTPDQQVQVEASGLDPDSGSLRIAIACLIAELQSGACMREFVDRASSQTPEQVRAALWDLALGEGGEREARELIAGFDGYQAFEEWFTTLNHYEMEDGDHVLSAADSAAMRIAFHQLRHECDPLARLVERASDLPVSFVEDSYPAGIRSR